MDRQEAKRFADESVTRLEKMLEEGGLARRDGLFVVSRQILLEAMEKSHLSGQAHTVSEVLAVFDKEKPGPPGS